MANQFIAINKGVSQVNLITVATSTQSKDFELNISTTHTPTKEDVILALNLIRQYILSNGLPAGETGVDLPVL